MYAMKLHHRTIKANAPYYHHMVCLILNNIVPANVFEMHTQIKISVSQATSFMSHCNKSRLSSVIYYNET